MKNNAQLLNILKQASKYFGEPLAEKISHNNPSFNKKFQACQSQQVKQAALAILIESQLEAISSSIKIAQVTRIMAQKDNMNVGKNEVMDPLIHVFEDLFKEMYTSVSIEANSIYSLLPLFFSYDMKNEDSAYLNKATRNAAYNVFLIFIDKFGLNIDELKIEFLELNPLHHLQPINEYIRNHAGDLRESYSNVDVKLNNKINDFCSQSELNEHMESKKILNIFKKISDNFKVLGWILLSMVFIALVEGAQWLIKN